MPRRGGSRWSRLYWLAAAGLAPWTVVLAITQPITGRAHDLALVSVGPVLAMAAGAASTGLLSLLRSPWVVVTGSLTAATAFIVSWFHLLTGTATAAVPALVATVVVVVPTVLLGALVATRGTARYGTVGFPPRGRAVHAAACLAVAALLGAQAVTLGRTTAPDHVADHLRLVWTGLDVFELVGLLATAWALHVGHRALAPAASATAALLSCDAWFNVAAATGAARASGIAMALVELPLAALSSWFAVREVSSWGRRAAVGPQPTGGG